MFLIDLMMFGMHIFANFETNILFIFLKGVEYKKKAFRWSILNPCKIKYFVLNTLEKNKQTFCFKIGKKITYQTSLNRSILSVFDRFDDVWYAHFCQFWNKKHHQIDQFWWFLIDLMMFGMQFFANLETKLLLIFL